jgi:beta-lactamase class A
MWKRRSLFTAALGLPAAWAAAKPAGLGALSERFAKFEKQYGGRLGVAVLDTAHDQHVGYRSDERFPMSSTFKFLLVTAILNLADHHQRSLQATLAVPAKPLLFNSPTTEAHAGGAMSVTDLCEAAITRSDNTATNMLLNLIGGPHGVTQFARSIGDWVTRLDRTETSLNEARAGDPRDTTSPAAMVGNLKTVLLGNTLAPASKDQLTGWMKGSVTGLDRLRAKLPGGWSAADKTGSNGEHTTNDIGVFWPPHRAPIVVAAYLTQCPGPESKRSALLAEIGQAVVSSLG